MQKMGTVFLMFLATLCSTQLQGDGELLWLGYGSSEPPRTQGLQGQITKELIQQFLPANPVIVEAGVYNGLDTFAMATMWPTSTIHGFEPIPTLLAEAKKNCLGLSNVHLYPLALSNKNGWATFYVSSGASNASSSLLPPALHLAHVPTVSFNKTIDVETITLDDWAKKYNIDKVDFLWLDMQCFEMQMLKASTTILKTVKVIMTEVNLVELYQGCMLYVPFKEWLESEGFEVVKEDLPLNAWGDVLFVRKQ